MWESWGRQKFRTYFSNLHKNNFYLKIPESLYIIFSSNIWIIKTFFNVMKDVTIEFQSTESPLTSLFIFWLLPPWKLKCCVSVETDELALSWRAGGESEGKKARTTNQEEKAFANPPILRHLCRLSHPMLFMCTKLTIKCMYHYTVGFALKKARNRQNISFPAHFFWSSIASDSIFEMHFHFLNIFGRDVNASQLVWKSKG